MSFVTWVIPSLVNSLLTSILPRCEDIRVIKLFSPSCTVTPWNKDEDQLMVWYTNYACSRLWLFSSYTDSRFKVIRTKKTYWLLLHLHFPSLSFFGREIFWNTNTGAQLVESSDPHTTLEIYCAFVLITFVSSPFGSISVCSSPRVMVFSAEVCLTPGPDVLRLIMPWAPSVTTTQGRARLAVRRFSHPTSGESRFFVNNAMPMSLIKVYRRLWINESPKRHHIA